jgi:methyl-accepting chemotaxis protein
MKFENRRRNVLIHRMQLGFVLLCLGYVLFFLVVLSVALFTPLILALRQNTELSANLIRASNNYLYLHSSFWPAAAIALVIIGLHAIRISHRVVGPLYRHRVVFQTMAKGVMPAAVHLRRGDFLQEQTDELNAMIEGLRLHLAAVQEEHHRLAEAVEKVRSEAEQGGAENLEGQLAALSEAANRMASELDYFRIES